MLLDTSGLLAYIDANDQHHADPVAHFLTTPALLTHGYVLAEMFPLFHSRGIDRRFALDLHQSMLTSREVELVWVDESLHRAAVSLLEARLDKSYSLADAVSFVLMRTRGATDALTTDRHFEQEGFNRLLKR